MQLSFIEHLLLAMYHAEDFDTLAQLILLYILHYLLFKD